MQANSPPCICTPYCCCCVICWCCCPCCRALLCSLATSSFTTRSYSSCCWWEVQRQFLCGGGTQCTHKALPAVQLTYMCWLTHKHTQTTAAEAGVHSNAPTSQPTGLPPLLRQAVSSMLSVYFFKSSLVRPTDSTALWMLALIWLIMACRRSLCWLSNIAAWLLCAGVWRVADRQTHGARAGLG